MPRQTGRFANIHIKRQTYLELNELKCTLRLDSQGETIQFLIDSFAQA